MLFKRIPWYLLMFTVSVAHAMPESAYKSALQLAEKKAIRNQHRVGMRAQGLSPTLGNELYGHRYQVGDSWEVASWQIRPTKMRKTEESAKTSNQPSNGGIFHYEVVRSDTGSPQQLKLKITQIKYKQFHLIDPKVESLFLSTDGWLSQNQKKYLLRGYTNSLDVSPEGIHSGMTPLEVYPLDFPDLNTAIKTVPTSLPQLPQVIQESTSQLGFKVDISQCQWFEQDDFFGRPIQVLWQKGDPWPAYIKTSGGISILIHRDNL